MAKRLTIFLDDGGVMSDNALRGEQWQRLVGEFFAPRLGGDPASWAKANRVAFEPLFLKYESQLRDDPYDVFWNDAYQREWLQVMCDHVGVPAPRDDECLALARQASAYVTRRVSAAFPGVADTIKELHTRGFGLHAASGEHSDDLEGYLGAMGVRDLFGRLYGPDLVETSKGGPLFYQRIFDDAGVEPGEAVVVDNSPDCVRWAGEAGALAVPVSTGSSGQSPSPSVIGSLTNLPNLMERIEG